MGTDEVWLGFRDETHIDEDLSGWTADHLSITNCTFIRCDFQNMRATDAGFDG
jgi:hypothetical protein